MNNLKDEYIEKPLWVRLIMSLTPLGHLDRTSLLKHEAGLLAYALFAYVASYLVPIVETVYWMLTTRDLLHFSAFSALFLAYVSAIIPRLRESSTVRYE